MTINKKDIANIITKIKIQCPDGLNYSDKTEFELLIEMWYEILKDYPKEIINAATLSALKNTVYQRQNWIGAIVQEIDKIQEAMAMSEAGLWGEIQKSLTAVKEHSWKIRFTATMKNGKTQGENAIEKIREIYGELPEECREWIRNPNQLIELSEYDYKTLAYEKSQFMKSIKEIRERLKIKKEIFPALPETIKKLK